jgi:hypothetical protein
MLKILLAILFLWLTLGAAGSVLVDLERPFTLTDIALGPITLGHELERQT